jgi:hypothetical protein
MKFLAGNVPVLFLIPSVAIAIFGRARAGERGALCDRDTSGTLVPFAERLGDLRLAKHISE